MKPKSLRVSGLSGFLLLIRPTNGIIFLMLFFYGITSIKDFSTRIDWIINNRNKLLLAVFLGLIVLMPQLLYWKWITGHWVFNSYVGERFYFSKPKIICCMVSAL